MTRSQKLRLKRWILREIDRSLSRAPLSSAQHCYIAATDNPVEGRDAVTQ
jgi:hypothetical protein